MAETVIGLVVAAFAFAGCAPELRFTAGPGDNGAKVYFGVLKDCKKPATCAAKDVFAKIPEYKEILDHGLTKDDAEYWVLLAKANDKFYKAVESAAKSGEHDCIVEKGSTTFEHDPPDVTQKIIDAIK